jgi:hypothetical protein
VKNTWYIPDLDERRAEMQALAKRKAHGHLARLKAEGYPLAADG